MDFVSQLRLWRFCFANLTNALQRDMAAFDESLLRPLIANVTGFLVGGGISLAEELHDVRAELH